MSNKKNNFLAFSLLFIQPIFMASNLIVARGGVEYVPPISLAFWRWTVVVLLLLPFTYSLLIKNSKIIKQIRNSKYNNKILPNGDIRIGNDMAMDSKTHIIYKL